MSNPFNPSDLVDVVKYQIFEDVKASYPLTFEQLIEQVIYCDPGEKPTDSLVEFVEGKIGEMVQSGVLLKLGDVLSIPVRREVRSKVKRQQRPWKEAVVDPNQTELFAMGSA